MTDANSQLERARTFMAMLTQFEDEMRSCPEGIKYLNLLEEFSEKALWYAYNHFTDLVAQERERQLRQIAS